MNLNPFVTITIYDIDHKPHEILAQKLRHNFQDLYYHPSLKWELYKEWTVTELTTGLAVVRAPSLHHAIQILNKIDKKKYFASLQKRRLEHIKRKKTKQ